jgi:hypothetical protein
MTAHQRCEKGQRSAGENLFWSKAASFERTSGYEALLSAPEALAKSQRLARVEIEIGRKN